MQSRWHDHLNDEEDKKNFKDLVGNSHKLLERLHDIIEQKIEDTKKKQIIEEGFTNPNWPLLQAHYLGQIKSLLDIQKLTGFTKGK